MTDEQFDALMVALGTIAATLDDIKTLVYGGVASAQDDEGDECPHPEEKRADLSTPHDPDHWICSMCRYEHQGLIRN